MLSYAEDYILPIYPFLFVFAGRVANLNLRTIKERKLLTSLLSLLSIWDLTSSISIYPHYLAYFNEIVGGPDNGYKYLVDSNIDWGQDLKGLKRI